LPRFLQLRYSPGADTGTFAYIVYQLKHSDSKVLRNFQYLESPLLASPCRKVPISAHTKTTASDKIFTNLALDQMSENVADRTSQPLAAVVESDVLTDNPVTDKDVLLARSSPWAARIVTGGK